MTPAPASLAIAICLGGIVGSFIGAAVVRVPEGRGIVMGRSRCDSCDHVLGPGELVPILSYLARRGRCKYCGAVIAIDQPLAEIGGVVIALLALASGHDPGGAVLLALFGWAMLALALLDWRHFWLPDPITLLLIPGGLLAGLALPAPSIGERMFGAVLGYAILEAIRRLYRRLRERHGLGAGDPKLLAAIGAWLGVEALPWVVLIGAGLGLIVVALRHARAMPLSRYDRLPLGTGLALAAICLIPASMI